MLACCESRSDRLRPRGHNYILPTCTNSLHGQSFINRTLFDFFGNLQNVYCVCLFNTFTANDELNHTRDNTQGKIGLAANVLILFTVFSTIDID